MDVYEINFVKFELYFSDTKIKDVVNSNIGNKQKSILDKMGIHNF